MRVDGDRSVDGQGRAVAGTPVEWPPSAVPVDAVCRTFVDGTGLDPGETVTRETFPSVGPAPVDSQAVAGHVVAPDGTIAAEIAFAQYAGADADAVTARPWLDVTLYDATAAASDEERLVVASTQPTQGYGHTSVDVTAADGDVYYVVARLVSVPGAVDGHDLRAHLRLSVSFTAAEHPALSAVGRRTDDGPVFTPGALNRVHVTVTDISDAVPNDAVVEVYDHSPWPLVTDLDALARSEGGRITLAPTTAGTIRDGGVTRRYVVEAPATAGQYGFGTASVELATAAESLRTDTATLTGTDTSYVVEDGHSTTSATDWSPDWPTDDASDR
jgi:hypothetical protein